MLARKEILSLSWDLVASICKFFLINSKKASKFSFRSDFFWALNWRIPFRIVISSASLHILWNGCFFSGSAFLLFFDFLVTAGSVPLSSSTALFLLDLAAEAEAAAGGGEVFRICSGSDPMSSDEESSVSSTGSRAFLLFFDFLVTVGSVPLTSSTALFLVDLALDFFDLDFFLAFLSDSDSESWAGIMAEGVLGWGFVAAAGGGEGSDPISSDEEFSVSSSPEEIPEETGSRAFAILRALLWDIRRFSEPTVEQLSKHEGPIKLLHLDPHKIVTGGPYDSNIKVWETDTGKHLNSLISSFGEDGKQN
ncbi:WD repeat-containing protein 24 homolog [Striga asiatica]|uniref:WD repeat-containing protein 24 homolog n=1 Tax=Striga asiatica TaxID=4170 RepID=A0A5A7QVQ0_STRAF|nr:WD repeat-containing protein 24 homolog [Striga asiatica]